MATIRTAIQLYDKMSPALRTMNKVLGTVIDSFESMQRASSNPVDTSKLVQARQELDKIDKELEEVEEGFKKVDRASEGISSTIRKIGAAAAALAGLKKVVDLSDTYTQTTARLDLMNDGLQTTAQLQDKIFASAQRSRAAYQTTADAVAKMGLMAGDAFSSNDEIIAFTEQINKQFTIAGTSAAGVDAAMLQLTQAMASGVLRGEELNSIFEQAPTIIQSIADYLDVPIGQIRGMAQEGQITASIVKNAMFATADETNAKFNSMPMTWAQVWTNLMNKVYMMSLPLLKFINLLANNFNILLPLVLGVAGAFGVYMIAVHGVAAATAVWTAVQTAFNAVMALNPIFLIIMGIILLIAIIYAVVAAVNKATGETTSAFGVIMGALATVGAFIWNVIVGVINAIIQFIWAQFVAPIVGIFEWVFNVFNGGFDSFGDAVFNLLGQIVSAFLEFGKIVTKIIDALFGTNWTAGLSDLQDKAKSWGKNENAVTNTAEAPTIKRMEYGKAYNAGYNWGASVGGSGGVSSAEYTLEGIKENTDIMAGATGEMSETLKDMIDIAEREAINRFTTAEITIEQTNNNNISSTMDIDGVMEKWNADFTEVLETAAEGVHE